MLKYSGKTDTGKKRQNNEDSFRILELDQGALLAVVCDGMGGAVGGEVASASAIDAFCNYISEHLPDLSDKNAAVGDMMRMACATANSCVFQKSTDDTSLGGMGTTLVAALFYGRTMYVANIGDSRLYIISDGTMTQLTRDHSWVQMWVDLGQMTPEEAAVSPSRNAILRAVGIDSKVESDLFTVDFTDSENATILLCSDGLSDYLSQKDILNIINDSTIALDDRVSALIDGANKGGGGDNITAVLFEIE